MDGDTGASDGQAAIERDEGLDDRRRYGGLIGVHSKVPIRDRVIPSLVQTLPSSRRRGRAT